MNENYWNVFSLTVHKLVVCESMETRKGLTYEYLRAEAELAFKNGDSPIMGAARWYEHTLG